MPEPLITDWIGSIATGLGALLTGGALWVTYNLFRSQHRALQLQEVAIQQDRADREKAQARLASASVQPMGLVGDDEIDIRLRVRNLSDEPLIAVVAVGLYEAERTALDTYRHVEEVIDAFDHVPPRETLERDHRVRLVQDTSMPEPPDVRLKFTDSHGLRWTRWPDGTLERMVGGT